MLIFDEVIDWGGRLGEWYGGNLFYWWHRIEVSGVDDLGEMSPENWKKPNDFENGTFFLRFELLEQPTDTAFVIQFGIWQDLCKEGGYSETFCDGQFVSGGAGSEIEVELGAPVAWWQKRLDAPVDFQRQDQRTSSGSVSYSGMMIRDACPWPRVGTTAMPAAIPERPPHTSFP